ncbi:MAG: GntR family transcriptional regulator [Steroidobacteraceae bacterium]|jgi:GntR family transcriptional regulator|nr:GntR family transcriptional regulator [Steroidobacteraceae bacterium]
MTAAPGAAKRKAAARAATGVRAIPSPRYHQVYVTLRAWVRDGTYRPGDQIPTEPELCRMFDVSRITVRKAIEDLSREGWLVRQQGKGTFVQMSAARPAASLDLDEARSQVADLGAATEVRDLVVAEVPPDEETRAALDLPVSAQVQRAAHVRMLRGVPLGLITTFVPLEVAARVSEAEMASQPMFELLAKAGIEVARADQLIGATLAGVEAARALGVEVGAPLLRLTRVVFDVRGKPVERVVALYRADAYQYHMQLRPPAQGRS